MPKIGAPRAPEKEPEWARSTSAVYIDPGNRYTGVAIFERNDADIWRCVNVFTWDVQSESSGVGGLEDWLFSTTRRGEWDIIGYEVWRLFEDKAQEQKGSEFEATQLIGIIKFLARIFKDRQWPLQPVEVVRFLPERKKPTMGKMKKDGYKFTSDVVKTHGDHAKDAELQGIYDLVHNRGWKVEGVG